MVNIISAIALKLIGFGFLDLVVFLLVLALLYAIFRKSKVFGTSPVINGLISFSLAFMVFVYPILTGINLALPISIFSTQATIFILVFVFAFILASLFYPNLNQWLSKAFTNRTTLYAMLGLGIAIFVASGLISVMYNYGVAQIGSNQPSTPGAVNPPAPGQPGNSSLDTTIVIVGLILFVVILIIASSVAMRGLK